MMKLVRIFTPITTLVILLMLSTIGAARVVGSAIGGDVIAYEVVRDTFRIVRNDVFLVDTRRGHVFNLNRLSNAGLPPVFSPDGEHLAFIDVQPGGGGEIFVADWTGRHAHNISQHPADDTTPIWSYDGRQLAFMSRRDDVWQLVVADVQTGALREYVTYSEEALIFAQLAWSPDNQHILYVESARLNVVDLASGRVSQVTEHNVIEPVWSPDGTAIAYGSVNSGNNEVYSVDVDGTHLRNLSDNPTRDFDPLWSPDGSRLAYVSGNSLDRTNIFVVDVQGGEARNLTNHIRPDMEPAWSPDGTRIAFTTRRDDDREVYVMRVDEGSAVNLTNHPAEDGFPIWSPDGEQLLFISSRDGDTAGLFIMNADGSNPRRLADANGIFIDVLAWRQ